MFGWECGYSGLWWICPIIIFIMIIVCIFMMRGCSCMSDWHSFGGRNSRFSNDSAKEVLDKRYALGEIGREEYDEMKSRIIQGQRNNDA